MNSVTFEPQAWSRQRWGLSLVFLALLQVALICWLTRRPGPAAKPVSAAWRVFSMRDQPAFAPDLADPTLFVLPNVHGFSGDAWLRLPKMEFHLPEWTEPARPLEFPVARLGSLLAEFVRTNVSGKFEVNIRPDPQLDPVVAPTPEWAVGRSTVSVHGALARRALAAELKVEPWPWNDILTNSEVEVSVNREGRVFSAALLGKCGSAEADAKALMLARGARFEPAGRLVSPGTGQDLDWGRLVFHWRTAVMPATNAPPVAP